MKKKLYTFIANLINIALFMVAIAIGSLLQREIMIGSVITAYVIEFAIAFVLHSIAIKIITKIAESIEAQEVEDETETKD